jgi:hypothetical protein
MISVAHKQEQLSKGYVIATAAAARVNLSIDREHDYGIDGTFRSVVERDIGLRDDGSRIVRLVESGHQVDFQLKCSTTWECRDDKVVWSVKTKTYNDLVTRDAHACSIVLILMCLPDQRDDWLATGEDALTLRRCCYYAELRGDPVANENSTKIIEIPRANLLTPASVVDLLTREEERKRLLFE